MGRLLVVVLAVTLAAGCGGGGGKRLSKTEFAAKSDAVCRKFNRLSQQISSPKTLSELATAVDKLRPLVDQSVTDLRKLRPPKDEQDIADRWIDSLKSIGDDLGRVSDRAGKKDQHGVRAALQAGAKDQQHGNQLASQLGMTDCSE